MIRRWSRVNKFNFFFNFNSKFLLKFDSVKLLKAANYKKFITGITKFKRSKLSKWKRRGNWLPHTQIIKHWIRDYKFTKQLVRAHFAHSIFLNNFYIYNFNYIKRKNPLNNTRLSFFLSTSLSKCYYFYFFNKYENKNSFSFLFSSFNSNFFLINFYQQPDFFLENDSRVVPLLIKSENSLFNFKLGTGINLDKNFSFLSTCLLKLQLKTILEIYKIFIFFYYTFLLNVKFFCLLNCLN